MNARSVAFGLVAGALLSGAVGVVLALPVHAQGTEEQTSTEEIAVRAHRFSRDVMSPFCPGRTLADCPSPDAAAVRDEVRDLLAAGADEATIREQLSARFGEALRAEPTSALGFVGPVLALLAGIAVLALALRRLLRRTPASQAPLTPDLEAELEADLDRDLTSRGLD